MKIHIRNSITRMALIAPLALGAHAFAQGTAGSMGAQPGTGTGLTGIGTPQPGMPGPTTPAPGTPGSVTSPPDHSSRHVACFANQPFAGRTEHRRHQRAVHFPVSGAA